MAANLTINVSGAVVQVVNQVDSTTRVNSAIGFAGLGASESTYIDFLPIASGAGTALTLPAATIYFLYVKNLGGVNGTPSGNITVQFQATGGALNSAANSEILTPGGFKVYALSSGSAGGIIAVTLVASVNLTPVEIEMAA